MGLAKLKSKISVEDYLEGEKISPVKHEYVYGEIYAMAGTSDNHNRIVGNLVNSLLNHLRDSSCEPFFGDIKVRVSPNVYYYPDVLVSCEENPENSYFRNQPILIVEVISPSTREIDRREKLLFYQQMPSVQEYVIVEQEKMHVEIHRRQPDGRWITYFYNDNDLDEQLEFQSVGLKINLEEIYRRVKFDKKITEP
ncbi:MAG TPA: Uma2 family endonuclease [Pyrinomonadaceae bacterium]|jgi:Uma2 family endonuclease